MEVPTSDTTEVYHFLAKLFFCLKRIGAPLTQNRRENKKKHVLLFLFRDIYFSFCFFWQKNLGHGFVRRVEQPGHPKAGHVVAPFCRAKTFLVNGSWLRFLVEGLPVSTHATIGVNPSLPEDAHSKSCMTPDFASVFLWRRHDLRQL